MDLGYGARTRSPFVALPKKTNNLTPLTSPQTSYNVVYRSSKYEGFFKRLHQYFTMYSRFYILRPLLLRLNQFHLHLLEFLGFLILVVSFPFLLFSAAVLFIMRKVRIYLVKKFYPNAIICEDLIPRCILLERSHGIVTAVVWIHGKVTLQTLRSELEAYKHSILRKRLSDKFGIRVWVDTPGSTDYDLSSHIIQAPSKFYRENLTDEDCSHGQKSSLQKFVTSCVSKKLDTTRPPWEIIVIPQPTITKEKTCCVLRFHYLLLRDQNVKKFLGDIFTRKEERDDDEHMRETRDPGQIIAEFVILYLGLCFSWLKSNIFTSREDINAWINLRQKEWQFHPKPILLKVKFCEAMLKVWCCLKFYKSDSWAQFWIEAKKVAFAVFVILRAFSYIPIEIFGCFWSKSLESQGIRRSGNRDTRQVAWSAPIPQDFLDAIREKTDASIESVILIASSMALRNYYDETGLKNPKRLHVTIPNTSEDLLAPSGFKSLRLPTDTMQLPEQLNSVNEYLAKYPDWKILGSRYIMKNVSFMLPRAVAYLVLKKLFRRHPITFTFVDLEASIPMVVPTLSIWGQPVEEFIFWRPPEIDFCVSVALVRYLGTRRLAVVSSMRTIDRALTKKFGIYLNRIAESLGVNKSRIPFSRRSSSPGSSSCSSPLLGPGEYLVRNRPFLTR